MRKFVAGLVLALGVLGMTPSLASAHGGVDDGDGDSDGCGCCQQTGHWELQTYCRRVWVQDCCCGHWVVYRYQQWVWVWD